jgi:hypothetical protein
MSPPAPASGACRRLGRPVLVIRLEGPPVRPSEVAEWLREHQVEDLQ